MGRWVSCHWNMNYNSMNSEYIIWKTLSTQFKYSWNTKGGKSRIEVEQRSKSRSLEISNVGLQTVPWCFCLLIALLLALHFIIVFRSDSREYHLQRILLHEFEVQWLPWSPGTSGWVTGKQWVAIAKATNSFPRC